MKDKLNYRINVILRDELETIDDLYEIMYGLGLNEPTFDNKQCSNRDLDANQLARLSENYAHKCEHFSKICDFVDMTHKLCHVLANEFDEFKNNICDIKKK